jgi:hypothetical protein
MLLVVLHDSATAALSLTIPRRNKGLPHYIDMGRHWQTAFVRLAAESLRRGTRGGPLAFAD